PALPAPAAPPQQANGAIFNVATGYAPLFHGNRASQVGDPLTITLVEQTTTTKSAGSKTQRDGGASITPPTTGPLGFLNPNALKASSQSSFNGQGNASQTSTLAGEVSVTIAEVRANGTALVRGEKRLLLSQGQEWIQFAGIVRLSDIDADNRIASSRVADARIEYAGNGSVARAGKEGWLSKFFNMISPF
ncbi:flagellar basal body L-ring protein FlgH, partial [Novosphingobium sp. B 225]|uniref:flagellar basal body L-ring protein FlgH n=1 Tax=Novosphingobium sp. B 225 TaxID=1961849 RepID=UPI001124CDD5